MWRRDWIVAAMSSAIGIAACHSTPLAPGADKVKLTSNPKDVVHCTAVGNLEQQQMGPTSNSSQTMDLVRDKAVGLGANVVFVTSQQGPVEGVGYHCGAP